MSPGQIEYDFSLSGYKYSAKAGMIMKKTKQQYLHIERSVCFEIYELAWSASLMNASNHYSQQNVFNSDSIVKKKQSTVLSKLFFSQRVFMHTVGVTPLSTISKLTGGPLETERA